MADTVFDPSTCASDNLPLVKLIVWNMYRGRHPASFLISYEDAVGYSLLAVHKEAWRYDPSRAKVSAFITKIVKTAVKRAADDLGRLVRIGRTKSRNEKTLKLRAACATTCAMTDDKHPTLDARRVSHSDGLSDSVRTAVNECGCQDVAEGLLEGLSPLTVSKRYKIPYTRVKHVVALLRERLGAEYGGARCA
jgi:DNA-directed RNA polymerase specialized sigma24 family protein